MFVGCPCKTCRAATNTFLLLHIFLQILLFTVPLTLDWLEAWSCVVPEHCAEVSCPPPARACACVSSTITYPWQFHINALPSRCRIKRWFTALYIPRPKSCSFYCTQKMRVLLEASFVDAPAFVTSNGRGSVQRKIRHLALDNVNILSPNPFQFDTLCPDSVVNRRTSFFKRSSIPQKTQTVNHKQGTFHNNV